MDDSRYYTTQWQIPGEAPASYTNFDGVPTDAGTYKLVLTPTSEAAASKAEKVEITFTITPATLTVKAEPLKVAPGTSQKDVKETAAKELVLKISDASNTKALTKANDDNLLSLIMPIVQEGTLKNGITGADAPDPLTRSDEYVLDVKASFKQSEDLAEKAKIGNYVLKDEVIKVNVKALDLVPTEVQYVRKTPAAGDNWNWENKGTEIEEDWVLNIKTYDEKALPEDLVTDSPYFDVKVYKAGTDPAEELDLTATAGSIKGEWVERVHPSYLDADGYKHTDESKWIWQVKSEPPVHAGEYSYRLTYSSTGNIYDKNDETIIKVVIEKAPVAIQPKADSSAKFREHMTVKDVLAQFDYTVYNVENGTVAGERKIDRDYFWGTSYDDTGATQPYAPVLCLETAPKGTDINTDNAWKRCGENDRLSKDNDYRVIFSGNKAVYNADGSFLYKEDGTLAHLVDINAVPVGGGTTPDYVVVTPGTWTEKAHGIKGDDIEAATAVNIMTDKIAEVQGGGKTVKEATQHVYDPDTALFTARDQYKKAYLQDASNKTYLENDGTNPAFTYKWYAAYYLRGDEYVKSSGLTSGFVDCTDLKLWELNKREDDTTAFEDHVDWREIRSETNTRTLYRAGIYKLEVEYDNSVENLYAAESKANVYYVIEPRQVKVKLTQPSDANKLNVMTETTVGDFLDKIDNGEITIDKKVYAIAKDGSEKELTEWIEGEDNDYTVTFKVIQKVVAADNAESWVDLSSTETFKDGNTYALKIESLTFGSPRNHTAYKFDVDPGKADESNPDVKPLATRTAEFLSKDESIAINLNKMSDKKIVIKGTIPKLTKVYDGENFHIAGLPAEGSTEIYSEEFIKAINDGLFTIETVDGQTVTDLDWRTELEYTYKTEYGYATESAQNAGTYELYVSYKGSTDKYHSCGEVKIADIEITPRELTLDASMLLDEITAGEYDSNAAYRANDKMSQLNPEEWITNYLPDDKDDFVWNDSRSLAWGTLSSYSPFSVCERDKNSPNYERIKSDGVYYLRYTGNFDYSYSNRNNYTVKCEPVLLKVVRDSSDLNLYAIGDAPYLPENKRFTKNDECIALSPDKPEQDWQHTFSVIENIPYAARYTGVKDLILEGNLVRAVIEVPDEYKNNNKIPDTAVYQNQIEAAGGYILSDSGNTIEIVFDAGEGNKTFDIVWEPGYTEKFILNFDEKFLLPNLEDAVEPKSLSFNAPNKKMVVGETQQLDVKITKKQLNDVICLEYAVAKGDEEFLSVDKETGFVTALKPTAKAATIEVYPIHLVKGVKTPFDPPKMKPATVKIKVSDVPAPKIKSVKAIDTSATVTYTNTDSNQGYRREVYVAELSQGQKKMTEDEFKALIDSMHNEEWEGVFASAPKFYSYYDEQRLTRNLGTPTAEIDNLKTDTSYAVYVRNVSAIRTLSDGSEIVRSEKGTVKIFKTTKIQVRSLRRSAPSVTDEVYFPRASVTDMVYATPRIGRDKNDKYSDEFVVKDPEDEEKHWYRVKLSQGSVNIFTEGEFADYRPEAEERDGDWFLLPLEKEQLEHYANPQLSYTVYDENFGYTDLIRVDKNGKIKLNGIGKFYIRIKDTNTCTCDKTNSAWCDTCTYLPLEVTADIDAIEPAKKSIQMGVGEEIYLSELANYKEGRKVVKGYDTANVTLSEASKAAIEQDEHFKLSTDGKSITAVKSGGNIASVILADTSLNLTAVKGFKLTSKALSPVKSLKITDVIDDRFTIEFLRPGYRYGTLSYHIAVEDGRGRTIFSKTFQNARGLYGKWVKNKGYYYYEVKNLKQQSSYVVKVTALYGDESAKTVAKKVKTPMTAAHAYYLPDKDYIGGMNVRVSEDAEYLMPDDKATGMVGWASNEITSGNTYILTAIPESPRNKSKLADTLTWSSTDKKVVSVKARSGSFSASLKALKPGRTTIEVKSKIWKGKVIARYPITVYAVGDAYYNTNRFYDQDDPDNWPNSENPAPGQSAVTLPLSEGDPRKVTVGEYACFSFTVPVTGKYRFESEGFNGKSIYAYLDNVQFDDISEENSLDFKYETTNWLIKGRKVTLIVSSRDYEEVNQNPHKDIVSYYVRATCSAPMNEISGNELAISGEKETEYFSYTAVEDGYYKFTAPTADGSSYKITLSRSVNDVESGSGYIGLGNLIKLEKDDVVYGCIHNIKSATKLTVKKEEAISSDKNAEISLTKNGDIEYISFEAPEDGFYEFSTEGLAGKDVRIRCDEQSISSSSENDEMKAAFQNLLHKGEKVYLYFTSNEQEAVKFTVKVKSLVAETPLTVGTPYPVTIEAGKHVYIRFKAPADKVYEFYSADIKGVDGGSVSGSARIANAENKYDYFSGSNSLDINYEMSNGDEIILDIQAYSSAMELTVNVKEAVISEWTDDSNGKAFTIDANAYSYWLYKAPKDGCYEFTLSAAVGRTLCLYSSMNERKFAETSGSWNATDGNYVGSIRYTMKQGEQIYMVVDNSLYPSQCTVTMTISEVSIDKAPSDSSTVIKKLTKNEELTLEVDSGKGVWICFTADEDGCYSFKDQRSFRGDIYLCKAYSSFARTPIKDIYSDGTLTVDYPLKKNESLWLYVSNGSYSNADTIHLSVSSQRLKAITLNAEQSIALEADEVAWYEFTAPKAGIYRASLSNYDDGGLESYNKEMGRIYGNWELTEGEKVYIKVSAYSSSLYEALLKISPVQ